MRSERGARRIELRKSGAVPATQQCFFFFFVPAALPQKCNGIRNIEEARRVHPRNEPAAGGEAPRQQGTRVTATIYFIRHASHDHLGNTLSGRMPGIGLSAIGRGQCERLAAALGARRFGAVYTSPVQRARETAEAIARGRGEAVEVIVAPELNEIDFGAWTGARFDALAGDAHWDRWNSARGSARVPGGESMGEVQARVVRWAHAAALLHGGTAVAMVSHCDVIRAALAHFLGLGLDQALNFDVDPASVSRVEVGSWGGRVLSINEALA